MKSLTRLFTLLLCFAATSAMGQAYIGDWKIETTMDDGTTVVAKLSIAESTYTVDVGNDGNIEAEGKYTMKGSEMTVQDTGGTFACPPEAKGVYSIVVEGETLMMERVSDDCESRGNPDGVMHFTKM